MVSFLKKNWLAIVVVGGLAIVAILLVAFPSRTATTPARAPATPVATAPVSTPSTSKPAASTPAPVVTPAVPAATPADLKISVVEAPGGGTAGATYYDLTFTNITSHSVTIYGFPGVSAANASLLQVGAPAARTSVTPATITLDPGNTAYALLKVTDAGALASASKITPTPDILVYVPNASSNVAVPLNLSSVSGDTVFMAISPVSFTMGS